MTGLPTDDERVRLLREVLTATGAGIYLATHVAGPVSAEVSAAVRESDDLELRIGRAGPEREEDLAQRDREARAVLGAVIAASPERVVLTHGAAEAVRLVALGVLGAGSGRDRTVLAMEGLDSAVLEALRSVCEACGARLSTLVDDPATIPGDVALVAAAHLAPDGRVRDVEQLARLADSAGARLLLDASLSVGAMALDAASLGAAAVVAGTHRWLLGPQGMAFAWLGSALGESAPEQMRASIDAFPRGALVALARSVGWLLMYAELPWVLERTRRLADRAYEALAAIPGVRMAAGPGTHAGLLAWSIDGWAAEQAADELAHSVFAILDFEPQADLIRAGVGAWNREDELGRLAARVAELAAHTPASLPRRPSLTILGASPDGT